MPMPGIAWHLLLRLCAARAAPAAPLGGDGIPTFVPTPPPKAQPRRAEPKSAPPMGWCSLTDRHPALIG